MAFIFWLARRLPDCKTITPTLGESLDRKLSLREKIQMRLHLFTCDACARYLKQVKFLSNAVQAQNEKLIEEENPSINLSLATKERLKNALKSSTGFAF
ncbi:MAG TPA: zf-HC2 domain-containing protein [Pyrinomonadaceae bacterium]